MTDQSENVLEDRLWELFASASNVNRSEVEDDKNYSPNWTPSALVSNSLPTGFSGESNCKLFLQSNRGSLSISNGPSSPTAFDLSQLSSDDRLKPFENDSNIEKLVEILENQMSIQLPPFSVLTTTRKLFPGSSNLKESALSLNVVSSSLHTQHSPTQSAQCLDAQLFRYLDDEEGAFVDNLCDTMLRCVLEQNWVAQTRQEQLKERILEIHTQWLKAKISRAQLHDSVTTVLRALCPEGKKVDLDIVFRIWDEHDLFKLSDAEECQVDVTDIDQIRNLHTSSSLTASSAPFSTSATQDRISPSQTSHDRKALGSQITQEQIIVGHFCRHSITMLPRIMSGNPELPTKSVELKTLIKRIWAKWVKKRITRQQLLNMVASFVRESCPEAKEVDVIGEFHIWYTIEYEKQEKCRSAKANKPDNAQPCHPITTSPRPTLTEQNSHPVSSKCRGMSLTDEQIIVCYYCRYSLLVLTQIMIGKREVLEKVTQLKELIKYTWLTWVNGQMTRSGLIDSIAVFVRGTCHEAGKLDVYQNFKIWYTQERARLKKKNNVIGNNTGILHHFT